MVAHHIRNIVLVGHTGAGKTALAEAVLHGTGAIPRPGTSADDTTVTDVRPDEQAQGGSGSLATSSTVVDHPYRTGEQVRLTLLDPPGHPDVISELRAGLRAADCALFVVSAIDGVDGATQLLWQECAATGMPRLVVLTHLDDPRADYRQALRSCQEAFGDGVKALSVPVAGSDGLGSGEPTGVVTLLNWTLFDESHGVLTAAPAGNELVEQLLPTRNELVEGIIAESADGDLLDRYLSGRRIKYDQLVSDLETAVARGSFHPVVPVIPVSGVGVRGLIEVLVRALCRPST